MRGTSYKTPTTTWAESAVVVAGLRAVPSGYPLVQSLEPENLMRSEAAAVETVADGAAQEQKDRTQETETVDVDAAGIETVVAAIEVVD